MECWEILQRAASHGGEIPCEVGLPCSIFLKNSQEPTTHRKHWRWLIFWRIHHFPGYAQPIMVKRFFSTEPIQFSRTNVNHVEEGWQKYKWVLLWLVLLWWLRDVQHRQGEARAHSLCASPSNIANPGGEWDTLLVSTRHLAVLHGQHSSQVWGQIVKPICILPITGDP